MANPEDAGVLVVAVRLLALVLLVSCTSNSQPGTSVASATSTSSVAGANENCEVLNEGRPVLRNREGEQISSAESGETVVVTGNGFYSPATRVAVYWDSADSPPLVEGDIVRGCQFSVEFTVPVEAGRHQVIHRAFDPESSYWQQGSHPLTVAPE